MLRSIQTTPASPYSGAGHNQPALDIMKIYDYLKIGGAIPKWERLGLQLMPNQYYQLKVIEKSERDIQTRLLKMLELWKNSCTETCNMTRLINALNKIEKNTLAAQLQRDYQRSPTDFHQQSRTSVSSSGQGGFLPDTPELINDLQGVASHALALGRWLIPSEDVNAIDSNYPDCTRQLPEILYRWRDLGNNIGVEPLMQALENIDRNSLATRLREKYSQSHSPSQSASSRVTSGQHTATATARQPVAVSREQYEQLQYQYSELQKTHEAELQQLMHDNQYLQTKNAELSRENTQLQAQVETLVQNLSAHEITIQRLEEENQKLCSGVEGSTGSRPSANEQVATPSAGGGLLAEITESNLYDQRPDLRTLNKVLTDTCLHWQDIALELRLDDNLLGIIEEDGNGKREKMRTIYQLWLQRDVNATYGKLMSALSEVLTRNNEESKIMKVWREMQNR